MMVVEPKMTQPIKLDEELVNLFSSIGRRVQKPFLSFKTLAQLIEVWSRSNGHLPSIKC